MYNMFILVVHGKPNDLCTIISNGHSNPLGNVTRFPGYTYIYIYMVVSGSL